MSELLEALSGRIRASGEQLLLTTMAFAIVALLMLTAYVALMYALALAISAYYGPMVAALSIAFATLLIALCVVLWLRQRSKRLARLRAVKTRSAMTASTAAAMGTVVPMMVRASPVGSLLAVGVIAYVLSRAGQRRSR